MPLHPPSPALLLSSTQRRHSASLPLLEHDILTCSVLIAFVSVDLSSEWTVIEHMGHYSTQPDKQDSDSPQQFSSL
ncbi:hypothetical protein ERO13_A08G173950v2 [Gossypium hirsutum]|uniref:Uncharacterized protein n=3 Tax=Gossypium TaxID=3633 RepID=A0A5J5UTY5_GOSBA|nr:hypothetical protein ES319_A08G184200v1 [Gossypium barbadense]KAG4188586.1 hypothetical protein ERO13_A08G173950v2 [Gossypium hirsutum]TYH07071.1 hypothetical protein ES288_A08G203500v1 [Gossypium darwinii]TYJ23432.1 hypothetical protein E1A91_A08G191400v1 [Gossypium mustelinum]